MTFTSYSSRNSVFPTSWLMHTLYQKWKVCIQIPAHAYLSYNITWCGTNILACNKQYFNSNFAGSPTANTAIPSSDEPSPLSPCSPSVLVSGLSASPQTNEGEYNFFACMWGEKVVNIVHGNMDVQNEWQCCGDVHIQHHAASAQWLVALCVYLSVWAV